MKPVDSVAIARLAGVSRSTVSKVINNYPNISAATRARIHKVIEEHGYSANISARVLAGKGTQTLGFFHFGRGKISQDLLASTMVATVIESAAAAGYHILVYVIEDPRDPASAAMVRNVFYQGYVDAAIVTGVRNQEPLIEELIARGYILGVFDQDLPGHHEKNRVVANVEDEITAARVIEYLYDHGHREIALLNGDLSRNAGAGKSAGFLRGLAERGLTCRPEWVLSADFHEQIGYDAVRAFLLRRPAMPTAFAAVNDSVAFGAIRALTEAGFRVPEDVSVVGIDDHPLAPHIRPALTTFAYDFHDIFQNLIERVVSVIEGQTDVPQMQSYAAVLRERHSCQTLAGSRR